MKNMQNTYKSDYPVDELKISKALQRGEWLLEGASLPVIVIGEVAERLKNNKPLDNVQEVEFGIRESALSKYALSTLKTWLGENWQETENEGVPIHFRVFKNDRGLLKRPDMASFWGGWYKIPNPFEKYWKIRGLLK